MLTPCILRSCPLSSTAGNSRLVTSSGLCSTLTHACTACSLHRAIQILLPDSELPADFRHWLLESKILVFYKFWPLKLPINLASFGKPVVFLLFQSYVYVVTYCFIHNSVSELYFYLCAYFIFTWLFGHFGRKVDY